MPTPDTTAQLLAERAAFLKHLREATDAVPQHDGRGLALHDCAHAGCPVPERRLIGIVSIIEGQFAGRYVVPRELLLGLARYQRPIIIDWASDGGGVLYRLAGRTELRSGTTQGAVQSPVQGPDLLLAGVGGPARPLSAGVARRLSMVIPVETPGPFGIPEPAQLRVAPYVAEPSGDPRDLVRRHDGDCLALFPWDRPWLDRQLVALGVAEPRHQNEA